MNGRPNPSESGQHEQHEQRFHIDMETANMSRFRGAYAVDWPAIAKKVKDDAAWKCVRCGHPHEPATGHVLTVHHLTGEKDNNRWWNTIALCQRCHLSVQGRVDLARPWVLEHSDWFKVYVGGYYAWRYLGLDLTRDEVLDRLDQLLDLERQAVLNL